MKTKLLFLVLLPLCGLAAAPAAEVTYALVPKARLAAAIESPSTARAIETTWQTERANDTGFAAVDDYMIVIFVQAPAHHALWGELSLPVPNAQTPYRLRVSLSAGHEGLYVIDGGGTFLSESALVGDERPFRWLERHVE
ncbi:hypothetical protein [Actomonas aquatica]|uniref:7TM-DISM receptor extracellular domain-containing protein n=1 Tax=Actomonas aquatica TaxID=2866162 RepID=A0ABZ1C6G0_9BACT|nr:hypothetical protein [Opitutus sp. WL0086]WRQ87313.1 hypothetical protein K1X11_021070 [Opitutus sp. WL0086]